MPGRSVPSAITRILVKINPGVLWLNRYGQFGVEAQIPVNRLSGNHVGVLFDAHLYFDDIFSNSLGKPFI
jgi:hypothetical protein